MAKLSEMKMAEASAGVALATQVMMPAGHS
jgi:hypothetical protein